MSRSRCDNNNLTSHVAELAWNSAQHTTPKLMFAPCQMHTSSSFQCPSQAETWSWPRSAKFLLVVFLLSLHELVGNNSTQHWRTGLRLPNPALVVLLLFPSQAVLAGPFFPPACSPRRVLVRECQSKLRTFGCNPKLALEAFFFIQQNKKNRAAQ